MSFTCETHYSTILADNVAVVGSDHRPTSFHGFSCHIASHSTRFQSCIGYRSEEYHGMYCQRENFFLYHHFYPQLFLKFV